MTKRVYLVQTYDIQLTNSTELIIILTVNRNSATLWSGKSVASSQTKGFFIISLRIPDGLLQLEVALFFTPILSGFITLENYISWETKV